MQSEATQNYTSKNLLNEGNSKVEIFFKTASYRLVELLLTLISKLTAGSHFFLSFQVGLECRIAYSFNLFQPHVESHLDGELSKHCDEVSPFGF
jgi:hypothetical protein